MSPDSKLEIKLFFDKDKRLMYNITSENEIVVEDSPLGLVLDRIPFGGNLILTDSEISDVKTEQFDMFTGKQSHIEEAYKEGIYTFENEMKDEVQIIVRAYNSGIAFRCKMHLGNVVNTVEEEPSAFRLPKGKAWLMPYDDPDDYSPAYEAPFQNKLDVNAMSPTRAGWAFPALFSVNNNWILVSESDNDANYCSIHLSSQVDRFCKLRLKILSAKYTKLSGSQLYRWFLHV